MTDPNPPAAFDPDHLPTVAEFDDMVDHNRAHGRVFSFAPAVIRELLGELERLREELSQADTFGRGEFRVTTWAYEQAVRTMNEAKAEVERLRAREVPDTGQAPESPTDSTPEAGRGGSGEAETTTGTVQAPTVAEPIDWLARFRAAADVADARGWPGTARSLWDLASQLSVYVVSAEAPQPRHDPAVAALAEAIGRALLGTDTTREANR